MVDWDEGIERLKCTINSWGSNKLMNSMTDYATGKLEAQWHRSNKKTLHHIQLWCGDFLTFLSKPNKLKGILKRRREWSFSLFETNLVKLELTNWMLWGAMVRRRVWMFTSKIFQTETWWILSLIEVLNCKRGVKLSLWMKFELNALLSSARFRNFGFWVW